MYILRESEREGERERERERDLEREGIHVSSESKNWFPTGPNGSDDAGLGHRPLVFNPKRVQLGPDELTRLQLLKSQLWVLVDSPPNPSHPLEELTLPRQLQQLTSQPRPDLRPRASFQAPYLVQECR